MIFWVVKLPEGDAIHSIIAPEAESPQKVDPQVLKNLLEEFKDLFPDSLLGLPTDKGVQLLIPLIEDAKVVWRPLFCYNLIERKEIEEQVDYLLKRGLIIESSSPFGAPVLFVPKPNSTLQMCIDYKVEMYHAATAYNGF